MNNAKVIYLLVGPKGSGKSFIGTIMETEFGIKFIRVEDWAKSIKKERQVDDEAYLKEVFTAIENGVRQILIQFDRIVFESTGLTVYFDQMLDNLKKDFEVVTIGVKAAVGLCLLRVNSRDGSIHIDVSDDQLNRINEQVREKNLETDHWLLNEDKTKEQLITELEGLIKK